MKKICFVCHGNICRSPMAEFVLRDLLHRAGMTDVSVASCATSTEELGKDTHPGTKRILREKGIPFTPRRAWQARKEDYAAYDAFFCMDSANARNLLRIFGGDPQGKVHKLLSLVGETGDVADPWYTGNFEQTYVDVQRGCMALLDKINTQG